jgi:hypothetical protein
VHAVWHVDAALAQFFLLLVWQGSRLEHRPPYVALDRRLRQ